MVKQQKFFLDRTVVVAICILFQALALVAMILRFNQSFVYFYSLSIIASALAVLWIVNDKSNPSYKIAWIIPILLFPVLGGLFYLFFGGNKMTRRLRRKMSSITSKMSHSLKLDEVIADIESQDETAATQARYLFNASDCPPYKNTYTEYLPLGEVMFEKLKEELKKAEHFIFLEYFIIEEGLMWNSILGILAERAKAGIDVRIIYDDIGCIKTLPLGYNKKLEAMGIKCSVFNPFIPVLSTLLNNRDHRKIAVIDGHTAFTGGINLADEYINAYPKHGHWKDTAVMIKGEAVFSFTVMFLTMWDYQKGIDEDYELYKPSVYQKNPPRAKGYVQPFTDNPLDDEPVGGTVYLNLINKAKRYVYITTPYLIIDNELTDALTTAAKAGIDVRIITPHIPDKWYVHAVTRANYAVLLESGVKIYEYTPGFIHAKTFVVDDEYGVVGTINLDYRSLFLHFECGLWMYQTSTVSDLKVDFQNTLRLSQEITLEECRKVQWYRKLGRAFLQIFAPMM